jgi:cytochrome c-type biogenesis protein CcmH
MLFISLLLAAGPLTAAAQDLWPDAVKTDRSKAAPVSQLLIGLEEKLARNPDDAGGWLLLAQSYRHLGQPESARRAYEKASQLGKTDAALETWLAQQADDDLRQVRDWVMETSPHE